MTRRYIFGTSLWQHGEGDFKRLQFGTIRKTYKEALTDCKKELLADGLNNSPFFKGVIESEKFVNGYWHTVKVTIIEGS